MVMPNGNFAPLSVQTRNVPSRATLISSQGRSMLESKPAQQGTPVPVSRGVVRFVTVFHDLSACPMTPDVDPFDTINAVLASISAAAPHGTPLSTADTLPREWRVYQPYDLAGHQSGGDNVRGTAFGQGSAAPSGSLTPDQLEQFTDLGLTVVTVGRKRDAAANKLRDDVLHFIESHSDPRQHAVVMVGDCHKLTSEIRSLNRIGVATFIVSCPSRTAAPFTSSGLAAVPALLQQSSHAHSAQSVHVARWDKIVDRAISAAALQASTPMAPSAKTDKDSEIASDLELTPDICHPWIVDNACNEQPEGSLDSSSVEDADDQSALSVLSASSDSGDEDIADSPEINVKVMPMTPRLTRTVPEAAEVVFGQTGDDEDEWTTPRANIQKDKPAESGDVRTPRIQRSVTAPAPATKPLARVDSEILAASDPYRIVFGHLELEEDSASEGGDDGDSQGTSFLKITERNTANTVHRVATDQLDYKYAWLSLVRDQQTDQWLVCCRLHNSGRITDIRLCGEVQRVVRTYGFIAHPLFPENLYFRLSDVDTVTSNGSRAWRSSKSAAPNVNVKDVVAFRVGQKDNRVWALRIWKVPSSVARFITESSASTASGSVCSKIAPTAFRRNNTYQRPMLKRFAGSGASHSSARRSGWGHSKSAPAFRRSQSSRSFPPAAASISRYAARSPPVNMLGVDGSASRMCRSQLVCAGVSNSPRAAKFAASAAHRRSGSKSPRF